MTRRTFVLTTLRTKRKARRPYPAPAPNQPDVDGFIVEILDADNAQVFKKTYAELKQQLAEPMELPVGAYRMEVRSERALRT